MTKTQHHIIRRQILEIEVEGTESDGLALQRRLPGLCQGWLLASLEGVLDRLVPADEYWTIDRLDIDAGSFRLEAFERGLVDAVTLGVERYFHEHAARLGSATAANRADGKTDGTSSWSAGTSGAIERRSQAQSLQRAFLHFLQTGILPWWCHLPQGMTLEDVVRESWQAGLADGQPRDFAAVLTDAMATATVRTRLVRQFSPAFLYTLLSANAPESATAVRHVLEKLNSTGITAGGFRRLTEQVWQTALLMSVSGERPTVDTLVAETLKAAPPDADWRSALPSRLANLRPDTTRERKAERTAGRGRKLRHVHKPIPSKPTPRATRDDDAKHLDLDEGVYVNCAGVVLLHPFLPRLFEAVGIAKEDTLLQPERALRLLHFLATGERVAPEYQLLLAKVLCGVPPETPIEATVGLTMAEEEEASALLTAVIRHWDALGETSAAGLRNTFLARAGRLSRRGGDDLLQVEALSFDILLDRLPWSIGIIQLPWMERRLWVEWRL